MAKEKVRDVYLTDDPGLAAARLDSAVVWCAAAESGPELRRLTKVLRRWRNQILAHHSTGASNGPVEAMNLLIKQEAFRPGLSQLRQLPPAHPPRRRRTPARDSSRHEHPHSPSQVRRVGPTNDLVVVGLQRRRGGHDAG